MFLLLGYQFNFHRTLHGCIATNFVHQYLYAFPIFSMINMVLIKIAQEQVKGKLAVSGMVPNPSGIVNRKFTFFTKPPHPLLNQKPNKITKKQ